VTLCSQVGSGAALEDIACDAVAMSGGWSPVVHLWSHCGGKLLWDEARAHVPPRPRPPAHGRRRAGLRRDGGRGLGRDDDGRGAGRCPRRGCARGGGQAKGKLPEVEEPAEAAMEPVWMMPQGAGDALKSKMWLDFQNDVKVSDVELAAREGFESVEHAKRYTTLGMATDQGN
jgi:sarcosine oxidase, subunit alpha